MAVRRRQRQGLLALIVAALAIALLDVAFSALSGERAASAAETQTVGPAEHGPRGGWPWPTTTPTASTPPQSPSPPPSTPTIPTIPADPPIPEPTPPPVEQGPPVPVDPPVQSAPSTEVTGAPQPAPVPSPDPTAPQQQVAPAATPTSESGPVQGSGAAGGQRLATASSGGADSWLPLLVGAGIILLLVVGTSLQMRHARSRSAKPAPTPGAEA